MAEMLLVRPGEMLPEDRREELRKYLVEQFIRAKRARTEQVDNDYDTWNKAYYGVPLEKVRAVPFYKASNFVVKLCRIFLDTFVARTLNIVHATRPVYVADGLPREFKDSWEYYLNHKALYEWSHYQLHRDICFEGNKNGTCVVKTPFVHEEEIYMKPVNETRASEIKVVKFDGPCAETIPFEDFFIYPFTAKSLRKADILFHRIRYTEERARDLKERNVWQLKDGQKIEDFLLVPNDVKRVTEASDAGLSDPLLREMQPVECHLRYAITNDPRKLYNIIALLEPQTGTLLDVYYNPYVDNLCIFNDYRPFPRESLFFGESLCSILGQAQEEASRIHNERRDNSTIASSVVFKRRSGALVPNPSTNWYPGKVFDVEDLDDLEVVEIGRNYSDMIEQEQQTFQLAEQISGIGQVMQGQSTGGPGKHGQYNTMGTIAVMAEGNQRQDTNIRDVRVVIGVTVAKCSFLQAQYGAEDPFIETLPPQYQEGVKAALQYFGTPAGKYIRHEVKASDAGINKEVQRASLVQVAQIVGQYSQQVMQMAQQLADPQTNPILRTLMEQIVDAHKWMATRLMREFDEADAAELLPDVNKIVNEQQAQQQQGGGQPGQQPPQGGPPAPGGPPQPVQGGPGQGMVPGGAPTPPGAPGPRRLPSLPQSPTPGAGARPNGGLGPAR